MANLIPVLIMTELQAARLRDLTMGQSSRIDPRKIDLGPYAGKYFITKRVSLDPAFADHADAFAMMTEVALDLDTAFYPDPEE